MADYGIRVADQTGGLGPEYGDTLALIVFSQTVVAGATVVVPVPPNVQFARVMWFFPTTNQVGMITYTYNANVNTITFASPSASNDFFTVIIW